ncbi:MAG: High-affinity glucose transporter rgt2 [Stictis urceolatum]|nr:High-affinity glucose transporter rgt2 [Stictis urceolata]
MGRYTFKKPADAAGKTWPAIAVGMFVAFGGVLYGYDTGTIGGIIAMPFWLKEFSTGYTDPATGMPAVTSSQTSEIVSILSAGTFFGALASAFFGDFFGRRMGLIYSNFVFILGVILQTAATHIPTFVAGRFFAGFGVGLVSALIPLYQSESAPKWIRGLIVGAYQWAITIGLFLAAIVNNSTHLRNDTGSYRIPIAVQFAWSLILITGLLFLPETPRYHIKRGRNEQAAKSLSRLRRVDVDHPALVEELAEIQANHEYEMSLGNASYLDCFKGNLGRRLLTGCLLQSLQQLTGVNFIFYYGTKFFTQRNLAAPFITTVITNVVNVVGTLPGLIGVEMFGRRPLLFWGAIGMLVCQFIAAAVGDNLNTGASNKAFVAFICIYIFFFASTWGPIAWVVTGEIFPLKARAKCLSMTTASNWLLNWAIAYATPYLVDPGPGNANLQSKVFYLWGSCCVVCAVFVWFMIYETKGLSLEQVDELYAKVPVAWKSTGFVPTVSFQEVQDVGLESRKQSLADMEALAGRKKSVVHTEKENGLELHE